MTIRVRSVDIHMPSIRIAADRTEIVPAQLSVRGENVEKDFIESIRAGHYFLPASGGHASSTTNPCLFQKEGITMLKRFVFAGVAVLATGTVAFATQNLDGSTTLKEVVQDSIAGAVTAGVLQPGALAYLPQGSGFGAAALVNGTQGIAPMSRDVTDAEAAAIAANGNTLVRHVIGLDGVSAFTKADASIQNVNKSVLKAIYAGADGTGTAGTAPGQCQGPDRITDWSQIPGSGKTGPIIALRRNDSSGTTDAFKNLVGIKGFCADVQIIPEADACLHATTDGFGGFDPSLTTCYAGLGSLSAGNNQALSVCDSNMANCVAPSQATVLDFSYPLTRRLYLNEVLEQGTDEEHALRDWMLVDSNINPIITAHEFVACYPGCP
jgi:ABC-type phosphate transport system substrate-binding protein